MITIFMGVKGVPTGNGWLFGSLSHFSSRHIASMFDLTSVPLATSVWMPLKFCVSLRKWGYKGFPPKFSSIFKRCFLFKPVKLTSS